jgi:ubiquinone/menaquinone biosynthesis C-methylase UbiE
MLNQQRQDREREHWRQWQDRAEKVWGWQTPAGRVRAARRAQWFIEMGHMTPQSVVLEIGCGTGEFTVQVAPRVGELWATDLSPDLLKRAETNLRALHPAARVKFQIEDAMHLSLAGAQFDAVFACSVLHHLDLAPALRQVLRVLKPGARCVFSEPNMLNPQIALQKNIPALKRRLGDSPDETAFFAWEMRRVLDQVGFEQVAVTPFDFLHPLTPASWVEFVDRLGRTLERVPGLRAIAGSLMICAVKPLGLS